LAYSVSADYHHDMLNPSLISPSIIIQRADAIWKRRGIRPKQHLSEPRPGAVTLMEQRAHADRCQALPPDLPNDMGKTKHFSSRILLIFQLDLMIEVCEFVCMEA
jgi:UV DNA damage endonuclease